MCGGRVDLEMIFSAFLNGADGVFIGTCLKGECHYTSGNLQAEARIIFAKHILKYTGLTEKRVKLSMMSSAESGKFVSSVSDFIETIIAEGKLPDDANTQRKLHAAYRAVMGEKIRWLAGKKTEFETDGNLYGEKFTPHEINRLFREVAQDEVLTQEIILLLENSPLTIKELAEITNIPPRRAVRQIANMLRLGIVRQDGSKDNAPAFTAGNNKRLIEVIR